MLRAVSAKALAWTGSKPSPQTYIWRKLTGFPRNHKLWWSSVLLQIGWSIWAHACSSGRQKRGRQCVCPTHIKSSSRIRSSPSMETPNSLPAFPGWSRRANTTAFSFTSRGPISMRIGTPWKKERRNDGLVNEESLILTGRPKIKKLRVAPGSKRSQLIQHVKLSQLCNKQRPVHLAASTVQTV